MSTEDGVAGRWDGVDVHFGEAGGRLTYGSYLRLAELLDQQRLESDPPAHDELLFITIHQVYELWFKQVLHELTASRDAMLSGELWLAEHLLRRVHTIERVLTQQVDILETMTPQDFGEFRHRLSPASGFQSVQFREIEFLSGAKDPSFVRRFRGLTETEKERLGRRLEDPTLWDAFLVVLQKAGFDTDTEDATPRRPPQGRRRPRPLRRHLGARRGAAPARRARRRVAGPPRRHGRADDRHQARHRRLVRRRLPAQPPRPPLLPPPLGPPHHPLTAAPARFGVRNLHLAAVSFPKGRESGHAGH